ncbi:hypothetical protein SAMN04487995_4602 [Dyadobacter koreensis]|uniref:Uncharacterized protein n=1 Tax=Dyadobacter koreensis TaxID=408657 RepID=A0A1H6YXF2_9BACT|nr:hypothetical protein [Dyadobacter koreensis]SEJ41940.1 hypothetical protein SAMN04487995_4602 [Dyadobacter koreensis]
MLVHTHSHWQGSPSTVEILSKQKDFPEHFKQSFRSAADFILKFLDYYEEQLESDVKLKLHYSLETYQMSILQHEVNKSLDILIPLINSDGSGQMIIEYLGLLDSKNQDERRGIIFYLISRFASDNKLADERFETFSASDYKPSATERLQFFQEIPYLEQIVHTAAYSRHHVKLMIDFDSLTQKLSQVVVKKERRVIVTKPSDKIVTTCSISQIRELGVRLAAGGLLDQKTSIDQFLLVFFDETELKNASFFIPTYHDDFRKQLKIKWQSYNNLFAYLFMVLFDNQRIRSVYWKSLVSKGIFLDQNGKLFNNKDLAKIISDHKRNNIVIQKTEIIDNIIKEVFEKKY